MKVKFVLNAYTKRCFKRINEFRELGFDVEAYAFDRGTTKQTDGVAVNTIGSFPNSMPYIKRIGIIYKSLKVLFRGSNRNEEEIWYYFGLQMCVFCYLMNKNRKYIYEESDMTHLGVRSSFIRCCLEKINKKIIKKSIFSVFTSEGFLIYHFGEKENYPPNVIVMPNKLNVNILQYEKHPKRKPDVGHLKFGFVGFIRYQAVYYMAEIIARNFPNHEFHFFGELMNKAEEEFFYKLKKYSNVYFHGFFKNPEELGEVYSNIDVVVSTYDTQSINVKYAEPNKLYESIYYRTPIIVSKDTYLALQVERYHTGWNVDAMSEVEVKKLVKVIEDEIDVVSERINQIPQQEAIDEIDTIKILISNKIKI